MDQRITVSVMLNDFYHVSRNIFPDNLAQAMFQHVKTGYDTVNVTRKRIELVPVNHSSADEINNHTLDGLQSTTVGLSGGNVTDLVRKVVTYQEEVVVRTLSSGNGINVLGKYPVTDNCPHQFIRATSWQTLLMSYANNKDTVQPAHPRSLISAFVAAD